MDYKYNEGTDDIPSNSPLREVIDFFGDLCDIPNELQWLLRYSETIDSDYESDQSFESWSRGRPKSRTKIMKITFEREYRWKMSVSIKTQYCSAGSCEDSDLDIWLYRGDAVPDFESDRIPDPYLDNEGRLK